MSGNDHGLTIAQSLLFLLCTALLPIIFLEFYFRRPYLLGRFSMARIIRQASKKRVLIKLSGLYFIFSIIALAYWVLPEYHGNFYQAYWDYLLPATGWLIILSIPYFWLVDGLQENPDDEYLLLGQALINRSLKDRQSIYQLMLGWLVKAFFLPLMITYLSSNIGVIISGQYSLEYITNSFQNFYTFALILLFTIDIAFVSFGYCCTLKLIDSHIRSTEPTMLGWSVALICYEPFASKILPLYSDYEQDSYVWSEWLAASPLLYVIWGSVILLLIAIYTLSSVAFGHRFSNLTHRGIITNGPYRYLKHPAYLTKNLSWWMISIPFVASSGDWLFALQSCLLLVLVNGIYYLRAKTEERHLSQDPVYREYVDWIDQHGLIATTVNNLAVPWNAFKHKLRRL
jgi:protein-S-isoprenylcysteine O-methyltransferase Ste14